MEKKTIIDAFLVDTKPEYLLQLLKVIQHLSIRYGGKFSDETFLQGLEKVHKDLTDLIRVLQKSNLLEKNELSKFIREFEGKLSEKQSDFSIISSNETVVSPLTSFLEKNFEKVHVSYEKTDIDGLMIKGSGYSVKRSLDNDVDKMLA